MKTHKMCKIGNYTKSSNLVWSISLYVEYRGRYTLSVVRPFETCARGKEISTYLLAVTEIVKRICNKYLIMCPGNNKLWADRKVDGSLWKWGTKKPALPSIEQQNSYKVWTSIKPQEGRGAFITCHWHPHWQMGFLFLNHIWLNQLFLSWLQS